MIDLLYDLTLNNPIFITLIILIIWFLPGILIGNIKRKRLLKNKKEIQAKKNQPKPKVETKLVYNYRLREWRNE